MIKLTSRYIQKGFLLLLLFIGLGGGGVAISKKNLLFLHPSQAQFMVPAAYADLKNPLTDTLDQVAQGKEIFLKTCASCHGEKGDGNGPAARGLFPPPANFTDDRRMSKASDSYLFYRITEGKPGTAMPSFAAVLSPEQKWRLITYLRSLSGTEEE